MNDLPRGSGSSELWSLLAARCDDTMTPRMWDRLNQLLRDDPDARRVYILHMDQHSTLLWRYRDVVSGGSNTMEPIAVSSAPPTCPGLGFLPTTLHNPLSNFSESWLVAYSIAAVICGIGILIGAFTYVSHYEQVAQDSTPAKTSNPQSLIPNPSSDVEFVGRITGMVDCKWADWSTIAINGAYVPLGRKYALASGLMEITYDTGAKVILQGPVTYEVESKDSGFLSRGKLTARIEKGGEGREERGEGTPNLQISKSPNLKPSPLSPLLSPLFAVRTPTTTVVDLGTEFGVRVDSNSIADVHVFSGKVKVVDSTTGGNLPREALLIAGEAMRFDPRIPLVRRTADSKAFLSGVERLVPAQDTSTGNTSSASSERNGLVAGWTFNEGRGSRVREGTKGLSMRVTGPSEWIPGKCGMAFSFNEAPEKPAWINTDYNLVGADPEFRKHFTVSVWVYLPRVLNEYGTIAEQQYFLDGQQSDFPHGFYTAMERDNRAHFGVCVADKWINMNSVTQLSPREWHHLGFVFDSERATSNLRIYVDGKLDPRLITTVREPLTLPIGDSRLRIGRHVRLKCNFTAAMDDLAFWNRALSEAEIKALCNVANAKELNYDAQQTNELFRLFVRDTGSQGIVGGRHWLSVGGLAGHDAGETWSSEGKYFLQLDDAGHGLVTKESDTESTAAPKTESLMNRD